MFIISQFYFVNILSSKVCNKIKYAKIHLTFTKLHLRNIKLQKIALRLIILENAYYFLI